jgi:hypothetical protein
MQEKRCAYVLTYGMHSAVLLLCVQIITGQQQLRQALACNSCSCSRRAPGW